MRRQVPCFVVVWLALSCAMSAVRAQPEAALGLTIEAPDGARCPTPQQLQAAVEARVGWPVFRAGSASRRVEIAFAHAADGAWTAGLRVRSADAGISGERTLALQTDDCQSLLEALTVVISTLVGIRDERLPARASTAPPPRAAKVPSKPRDAPLQPGFALALLGRADLGLLPRLAGGAGLMGELTLGDWSLALSALAWPHVTQDLGALARARLAAAAGRLQLCWQAGLALALCAGAEAGALELRSSGLAEARRRVEPFLRASLALRAQLSLTRQLALRLEIEANAPLLRARFYLLEEDGQRRDSHTLTPGVGVGLGVCWSFSS